jgi:hypothetical protein
MFCYRDRLFEHTRSAKFSGDMIEGYHMTVDGFLQTDLAYAPPFGPVWDPLLVAANQLVKKL